MGKIIVSWLIIGLCFFMGIDFVEAPTCERVPNEMLVTVDDVVIDDAVVSRESDDWVEMKVTAYCLCEKCCGKTDGITASGEMARTGVTVAGGSEMSLGTVVLIKGIGERIVQDRGSAISGGELDLLVESHEMALEFGVQYLNVRIVDGQGHGD